MREGIKLEAKMETRDHLKLVLEHVLETADLGVTAFGLLVALISW